MFRVTTNGLEEVPLAGDGLTSIPLSYFDKTLAERLGESLQFWEGLSALNGHPAQSPAEVGAKETKSVTTARAAEILAQPPAEVGAKETARPS